MADPPQKCRAASVDTYSRFCALLGERLGSRPKPAQMRFHYAPGLWSLYDFSGKTLGLRTGRGEKDVEIFVAVLAHSNLIWAEAVRETSLATPSGPYRAGPSPSLPCAVRRRRPSAGAKPARQLSLQPVAVGADDGGNNIV